MRYFKTANGWLRDTIDPVGVAMEDSEASLSAHYGVPVTGVEVDDDTDPREEPFVAEPAASAPTPAPTPLAQLTDALLADPNIAPETKEAIQQISGGDVKDMGIVPLTPRVK